MEGIRRTLQIVVFLAILLVTSLAAKGEESPTRYNREPGWKEYLRADRWARAMKYTGDPDSLARALTEPFDNIFLKYKTIYSWIAFNIAYDVPAYLGKSPRYNDPITVLDSQKTVCAGYAKLMCFLCKSVGLECEYVTGWAKNSVDEHLESIDEYPDHAWNAIYINEEWRYCDITWGAGSVLNNEKFIPGFTSAYFNMSAEKAFLQHFPQDKRWQNEYDMTLEEFDAQPVYSQSYFKTWTHGITHQVKYLKRGFLDSYWVKFRSKSEIRTLNAGGRLTLPFIRFGDYYLLCISPAQKGGITRIIINDEVTLAYINK